MSAVTHAILPRVPSHQSEAGSESRIEMSIFLRSDVEQENYAKAEEKCIHSAA